MPEDVEVSVVELESVPDEVSVEVLEAVLVFSPAGNGFVVVLFAVVAGSLQPEKYKIAMLKKIFHRLLLTNVLFCFLFIMIFLSTDWFKNAITT